MILQKFHKTSRAAKIIILFVIVVLIVLMMRKEAPAVCAPGRFVNPVTDVCWVCIFPIKIAGVIVWPGVLPDAPDQASIPVCACPFPPPVFVRIGIPISFWEPARYIETVKDPFCFPSLGIGFTNPAGGFMMGTNNSSKKSTFQQGHYFIFPVWSLMEMFTDAACVELSGFDVAYITEVDPLWNDDLLTAIIEPEAILFANPIVQMSCIADSAMANIGFPLDYMPWCMGSWGSAYPLTGASQDPDYTQANAGAAARLLYKMARLLLVCDPNHWATICTCLPTPIWIKHNYRFQIAMPVPDFLCHPIGRSDLIWGGGKNPPFVGMGTSADNFLWMIFRKHSCCSF